MANYCRAVTKSPRGTVRKLKEKEIQSLKANSPPSKRAKIDETQLQTEFLNYKKRYLELLEAEEIEKFANH
jgi:hypothetical protein